MRCARGAKSAILDCLAYNCSVKNKVYDTECHSDKTKVVSMSFIQFTTCCQNLQYVTEFRHLKHIIY